MIDGKRIPATVVTGFLGAGKTTLIRNLLGRLSGRRLALIVNEFGDIGFDGALLGDCGALGCGPGEIVELTNGCICCTVADDFLPAMEAILAREPAPEHILIETSGLALPQPLVRAFGWPTVRHRVTVDGVITVVDAEAVASGRLAPDPAAVAAQRAADPSLDHDDPVEELFLDQLSSADLVVLAKSDLLDGAEAERAAADVRRRLRPATRLLGSDAAGLPPGVLLGLGAEAESDLAARPSLHEAEGEDHDHDEFESFVAAPAEAPSLEALRQGVLAALRVPGVLRVKGHARVAGRATPAVVQGVGQRVEAWFAPAAARSGLVVIGLTPLDRMRIEAALAGAAQSEMADGDASGAR